MDKNTGLSCHFLLQGVFLTQGSNPLPRIAGGFFTAESPGKPLKMPMVCQTEIHEIKLIFFLLNFFRKSGIPEDLLHSKQSQRAAGGNKVSEILVVQLIPSAGGINFKH